MVYGVLTSLIVCAKRLSQHSVPVHRTFFSYAASMPYSPCVSDAVPLHKQRASSSLRIAHGPSARPVHHVPAHRTTVHLHEQCDVRSLCIARRAICAAPVPVRPCASHVSLRRGIPAKHVPVHRSVYVAAIVPPGPCVSHIVFFSAGPRSL